MFLPAFKERVCTLGSLPQRWLLKSSQTPTTNLSLYRSLAFILAPTYAQNRCWSLDKYCEFKGKASSLFKEQIHSVYCKLALLQLCTLAILQPRSATTGSESCQWNTVKSPWVTSAEHQLFNAHESSFSCQYVAWHHSFHTALQSVLNKFITVVRLRVNSSLGDVKWPHLKSWNENEIVSVLISRAVVHHLLIIAVCTKCIIYWPIKHGTSKRIWFSGNAWTDKK